MSPDDIKNIATMQNDIAHLTKSFDEFKDDTREFHRAQTQAIDDLKRLWQEVGGLFRGMADIQAQVNKNTSWLDKNGANTETVIAEWKNNKKRLLDYVWKFGWIIVTVYILAK